MYAIIHFITNTFITGFAFIGACTITNKVGHFFKILEENKIDGFKKGFDTIMIDTIDDIHQSVESVYLITNHFHKILFTLYDILCGNKVIQKDKDGKIIICSSSQINIGYKHKIEELNNKLKKYEEELKKMKFQPSPDSTDSTDSSEEDDNIQILPNKKITKNIQSRITKTNDEFYLETE